METTESIIHRLNRVEGQVRALKLAITDTNKDCSDILCQIKAARGALKKVADMYAEAYLTSCIGEHTDAKKAAEALATILKS
ncbi:MAG: metal-sensitive transcriptional regulator [Candidatus Yonathbacteria bacterium]|nr:metal-sensitive transcriptional regulator [Candidatus Yonathbacteria bacterium]